MYIHMYAYMYIYLDLLEPRKKVGSFDENQVSDPRTGFSETNTKYTVFTG